MTRRDCERLSEASWQRLLAEHALLPRGPGGRILRGMRQLLARKWRVSVGHIEERARLARQEAAMGVAP